MRLLLLFAIGLFYLAGPACFAQAQPQGEPAVARGALADFARQFVARAKKANTRAETLLRKTGRIDAQAEMIARLPEGEELLLQIQLPPRLRLEGAVYSRIEQGQLVVSLRDFIEVLFLPIAYDSEAGTFSGWYIRQNMPFFLDMETGAVRSAQGEFSISENAIRENKDLLVPAAELGQWFDFKISPHVGALLLRVESSLPFPVQERIARRDRQLLRTAAEPVRLPLLDEPYEHVGIPAADVVTRTEYRRFGSNGDDESRLTHRASVRTAGDFAGGTLTSLTQLTNEERISSVRATYSRESLEPELLGPLKARRVELGDVYPTRIPLARGGQALGGRITNIHPLRSVLRPSTDITGTALPGWDVELYRNNSLVNIQTVDDDGNFIFRDVELFSTDNNFRLVLYGLQGEMQEENLYIPVDPRRRAEEGSAYDVSLTFDDTQFYRKNPVENENRGAPHLSALYERPIGERSAAYAGLRSREEQEGTRKTYLYGGLSTVYKETLLNLNTAIDDAGEMAAELVARRRFGRHNLRNELSVATEDFENTGGSSAREVFAERFSINGPLPFLPGRKPSYNAAFNYRLDSDDNDQLNSSIGFNTAWKRFTFGQSFNYINADQLPEDEIDGVTTLSGAYGKNRIRLVGNYNIEPEGKLERVIATLNHRRDRDLSFQVGVERQVEEELTEASAQVNWRTGYGRISPSVTYNNEGELRALLNTRFGLFYDPIGEAVLVRQHSPVTTGGLSVLVFLDENGDGIFNEDEQAIPNARVRAPQNGGTRITDENGRALFTNLQELRQTDVYIDPESLQDAYWVPGFEGRSILPRAGHITEMRFPVHIAGEIDGTIYLELPDGAGRRPVANTRVLLYNSEGRLVRSVVSGYDGFYLFPTVPPGRYLIAPDAADLRELGAGAATPLFVEIGYEGTVLYAQNIVISPENSAPVQVMSNYNDYINLHPHVDIAGALHDRSLVLNLGEYNSRLLMALVWFKVRHRFGHAFSDAFPLVPLAQSYAAPDTGKHVLRIKLPGGNIGEAQRKCGLVTALADTPCTVEFLPQGPRRQEAALPPRDGRSSG